LPLGFKGLNGQKSNFEIEEIKKQWRQGDVVSCLSVRLRGVRSNPYRTAESTSNQASRRGNAARLQRMERKLSGDFSVYTATKKTVVASRDN
jgi:hypothetical protein